MVYQNRERPEALSDLIWLSQELGVESRGLALIAEGNVSTSYAPGRALVKASGAGLRDASAEDFVDVDTHALLEVLRSGQNAGVPADTLISQAFEAATEPDSPRPTVETLMHVTMLEESSATHVAHVHPTSVNAILCSESAELLVESALFPDQIVVLGSRPVLIDYVDPGIDLAEEVRTQFVANRDAHGAEAKIIYMRNHGIIGLGQSAQEALNICLMANKVAAVILGAASIGGVRFMSSRAVERIDSRPDEHHRRRLSR